MRTDRSQPLVSVVTPSLNQGRFLADTIESVASQSYEAVEHLVYDGGSTDGTPAVLARYADEITAVVGADGGQAAAINRGFREATGEIVGWLNSDDFYYPQAIESVVDYMIATPECSMVYGSAFYVDEAGTRLEPYPTGTPEDLRYGCFICQPAVFVRRRALEAVGLLDESLRYCMDYDLWLRMRERFQLHRIAQPLAAYRLHGDSKSVARQLDFRREVVTMTHRRLGAAPLTCLYGYADLLARERLGASATGQASWIVKAATAALTVALAARYHPLPTRADAGLLWRRLNARGALSAGDFPAQQ